MRCRAACRRGSRAAPAALPEALDRRTPARIDCETCTDRIARMRHGRNRRGETPARQRRDAGATTRCADRDCCRRRPHPQARPSLGLTAKLITKDGAAVVERPDIDIIVELFGGHEPARTFILKALASGKDVVTANKAMLAVHCEEIFRAAEKAGRTVGFEASVGGGIPIIRTLREALAGDRQRAVYGIVNGTCNYILTRMSEQGRGIRRSSRRGAAQRSGRGQSFARHRRPRRRP